MKVLALVFVFYTCFSRINKNKVILWSCTDEMLSSFFKYQLSLSDAKMYF